MVKHNSQEATPDTISQEEFDNLMDRAAEANCPDVIMDVVWDRLPRSKEEIRTITVTGGEIHQYNVIRGSLWDWDDHVKDEVLRLNLLDGEYYVSFTPVGEKFGMDSIENIYIYKMEVIDNVRREN